MHRVLLLWLELNRAVSQAELLAGSVRQPPWNSQVPAVREAWDRLTDPANLLALEQWLCQSAEGTQAEWARQALAVCREREKALNRESDEPTSRLFKNKKT
jgi:hypothetical protein